MGFNVAMPSNTHRYFVGTGEDAQARASASMGENNEDKETVEMNLGIPALSTKVTVGQVAGTVDVTRNLAEIERVVESARAAGSSLVLFPEAVMFQFTEPAETIAAAAQQHSAVFEAALQAYAERYRVAIVAGLYLPSPTAGRSRNVLSLLRPDGAAPIH